MKIKTTLPLMVSTLALLTACGGGSIVTPSSSASYKLTGTVPGTLIEAFCDDGTYHTVNSDNNGTSKHPFALSLPKGLSCRLVMTTNEDDATQKVVAPIKLNNGTANSIAFSANEDIDLGHVDLALDPNDITDINGDHVEDSPREVTLTGASVNSVSINDVNGNDPLDDDNDGIINVYEDDDGDGINNRDDNDDDGNGINDDQEAHADNDLDGDGIPNDRDKDDDNDGLNDDVDTDDDNDGINDDTDTDDDNDGINDDIDTDEINDTNDDGVVDSNDNDSNGSDNDNNNGNDSDSDNDSGSDNDSDGN